MTHQAFLCYISKVRGLVSGQVLIEPVDGLTEGLLLSPFLLGVFWITAHGKSVADTAEQIDLPRLLSLDENILGFVTERGGEDFVDLCWALAARPMYLSSLTYQQQRWRRDP